MTISLRVVGFTSARNAHRHLLKHVLRVVEVQAHEMKAAMDPEAWSDLLPSPPLDPDPERRRKAALATLREVADCPAGARGVTTGRPCDDCISSAAVRVVDDKLSALLRAYETAAAEALVWAFRTPSRRGPRAVAYRQAGEGTRIETWTERHVYFAGVLETGSGEVRTITCYRDSARRAYRDRHLALERTRAGHRARGTLVPLDEFTVQHVDT